MTAPKSVTVNVLMNAWHNCMYCGARLENDPILINVDKTHVIMWCESPGGICKYSQRRLRVPLTVVQCELADG